MNNSDGNLQNSTKYNLKRTKQKLTTITKINLQYLAFIIYIKFQILIKYPFISSSQEYGIYSLWQAELQKS